MEGLRTYVQQKIADNGAYPGRLTDMSRDALIQEFVTDLDQLGLEVCGMLRSPSYQEILGLVREVNLVAPTPVLEDVEFVADALHAACDLVRKGKVHPRVVLAAGAAAVLLLVVVGARAGAKA